MCLSTVKTTSRRSGEGWKIFEVKNGKLYSEVCGTRRPRPVNKWINSSKATLETEGGTTCTCYKSGFHIFDKLSGAKRWLEYYSHKNGMGNCKIFKVAYKEVVAAGMQDTWDELETPVVVARKIKILK